MSVTVSVYSQCPADQGTNYAEGLYINEVSQGASGTNEELNAKADKTCEKYGLASSSCMAFGKIIATSIFSTCSSLLGSLPTLTFQSQVVHTFQFVTDQCDLVISDCGDFANVYTGQGQNDPSATNYYYVNDSEMGFADIEGTNCTQDANNNGIPEAGGDNSSYWESCDISIPPQSECLTVSFNFTITNLADFGGNANLECSPGPGQDRLNLQINTGSGFFDAPGLNTNLICTHDTEGTYTVISDGITNTGSLAVKVFFGMQGVTEAIIINEISVIDNPIDVQDLTLCINETMQLTYTGTPNTVNPFLSSDPTIATVDDLGNVTGVNTGTTTVTFTNDAGCSKIATITVSNCCPSITFMEPTNPICDGNCENMMIDVNGPNTVNIPFEINGISLGTIPVPPGNNSIPICYGPAAIPPPLTIPSGLFSPGTYTVDIPPFTDSDGCPHNLGSFSITLTAAPLLDIPNVLDGCGEYTLPTISGTNLTGSEGYYTGSGGTGTSYTAGDIIYSDLTLYIYDGTTGCSDEKLINITVTPEPDIDPIGPINQCGDYLLPNITGTNLSFNPGYYTGSNGTGTLYNPGDVISSSQILYIFDVTSPGCFDEEVLDITINNQTSGIDNISDCAPITWIDGNTYSASNNTATHTLTAANGCDSIVTLNFTLLPQLSGTDIISDCNPILWIDGNTYSTSNNTAMHTVTATNGCDSIVTLNFTLLPQLAGTDNITDCNPITWIDGNIYNASNNTATQTLTAANGCDSIVTLNFTLLPQLTGTDNITDCNPITWIDGNTYNANNNTATHTVTAANGCDSIVTLNFTLLPQLAGTDNITDCNPITWIDGNTYIANNNTATQTLTAANGCDSIVTLNFTLLPQLTGTDNITDCNPITWIDGNTYSANNNTATHTLTAANGCDSIVTLNFTLLPQLTGTDNITDCNPITWIDGNTYTTSNNTATHTVTAANGCDSIVTLNFTLLPQLSGTDIINDCNPITWIDGNIYTTSNNTATQTLTAANGCDSIVTLNFTLLPQLTGTDNITDCNQITWIDGNIYNANNNTATQTLTAANGCDSIVTLNFTLLPQLTGTDNITDCNPITWIDGNTYTTSNNTATHTVTAANGCDSIVTLNFTLLPQLTGTDNITDCNPITWIDGNTYTTSNNTATHTVTAANGCDSIVTLNFTLLPQLTGIDVINDCMPITWIDGNTYNANNNTATHTVTAANGCDSIVTLNFTLLPQLTGTDVINDCMPITWIDGNTYNASNNTATHTLTAANGCDSIVTLNFTLLPQLTGTDVINDCNPITWIDGNTYNANNNTATHTLTAANGCDSIVTLNFTLLSQLAGTDVINDCMPITWIDGNTYNANNNTATHTLTSANGCDSIVTLNFTLLPQLTGTDNITDCNPITWIDGNTYNASNNTATHTLTAANGCDSIVTLNFTLLPQLTSTDDIEYCGPITWIDGNTYTTSNNTAMHALTSSNGCDSIVTLNFTLSPLIAEIKTPTVCPDSSGKLIITSVNSLNSPFTLTMENQTTTFTNSMLPFTIKTPSSSGQITLIDNRGCNFSNNYKINTFPEPEPKINHTDAEIAIESNDSTFNHILWKPQEVFDCPTCESTRYTIDESIKVMASYTYGDGCPGSVSYLLARSAENPDIIFPNAFAPEGTNRVFYVDVSYAENVSIESMAIYDRWGNKVFYSEDQSSLNNKGGWDGTINEKAANSGVYTFLIGLKTRDNVEYYSGDVVLVR